MKYKKLVMNARKPDGFWGKLMIRSMNRGHYSVTGWGLEKISFKQDYKVLDVGCGGGKTISRISKIVTNGKVYGIDYSELSVKKSRSYNRKDVKSGKVKIIYGSVSDMPYDDNVFDVVTGIETFYFWPDYVNDLKEVKRVLKPGGSLLLVFEAMKDEKDPEKWKKHEELINLHVPAEQEMIDYFTQAEYENIRTYTHKNGWLCITGTKPSGNAKI